MKTILFSISVLCTVSFINAQNDTLSAHCSAATLTSGLIDAVFPIDSGFVAGTNFLGDRAIMRLFDPTHEVTNGGTITGVAFLTLGKIDQGGSIQVTIWGDNNGTPNSMPIGSKTVTLAAIDTAFTSAMTLGDGNRYNNVALFTTPIAIPAGNKFWAGIVLPANGSALALPISITQDGSNLTHTGTLLSNGSFRTFGSPQNWNVDASIPVYPIVNFSGTTNSLEENNISASIYPNPTNSILNVKTSTEATSVSIISMDGKVVATSAINGFTGSVYVAELVNGVYFYEVAAADGSVVRNTFVKN